MTNDGRAMVEGFRYVRDVFRNIERLLLACDPILMERDFVPAPRSWCATKPLGDSHLRLSLDASVADTWLPYYVVRQYGVRGGDFTDLVTVGAMPWNRRRPGFDTALCIASRVKVSSNDNNDVYWLGLAQAWSEAPADGEVRVLEGKVFASSDADLATRFADLVPSGRLLSVARPLPSLLTVDDIANQLVAPLVKHPWPV